MNNNKYLTLKGRNKDTWYIQIRVPKPLQGIIHKEIIKKSVSTSDVIVAREERDNILNQLTELKERQEQGEFKVFVDGYLGIDKDELKILREQLSDKLSEEFPWVGHPEQGTLPNPPESETIQFDAMNYVIDGTMPDKYKLTLTQAMAQNWRYSDYSDKTRSSHRKAVQRFNDFMNAKDLQVNMIERYHALEFKLHLERNTDLANGTINRHFTDLGVIWNYARGVERYVYENPFAKHGIKVAKHRLKYKSWHIDDLRKVINVMNQETDKLMVYLAWYTGSRLGECLSVRPEDIYRDEHSDIWLVSIKPDDEERNYLSKLDESVKNENARRVVPVHECLVEPLIKFKNNNYGWYRKTNNAYSNAFSRAKKKIKDPVNPVSKQYSFHSIRHNVATNFQRAKVEESISARLVGHSTVGATMTYGYYSEGVEFKDALEAVNKLPTL